MAGSVSELVFTVVKRSELENVTCKWISLWCAPVDWELFDRLHSDDFEDMSSAGREPSKQAFAMGLKQLIDAFPDLQTRVIDDVLTDELELPFLIRLVDPPPPLGESVAQIVGDGVRNLRHRLNLVLLGGVADE